MNIQFPSYAKTNLYAVNMYELTLNNNLNNYKNYQITQYAIYKNVFVYTRIMYYRIMSTNLSWSMLYNSI